jgi:hypothetical protein
MIMIIMTLWFQFVSLSNLDTNLSANVVKERYSERFSGDGIIHRESKKRDLYTFANILAKYWPIFKIFSTLNSELNIQQSNYYILQQTLNM